MSFKHYLTKLVNLENLSAEESELAVDMMLSSSLTSTAPDATAIGAFLALLRAKGESPSEIAGMVKAMYKACVPVHLPGLKLLDIVGTGGDGADTINISTASIILAAACGCICSKAGNRSVSSLCGSADVLEKLGVIIDLSPQQTAKCIETCGLGFMYAPINHPAMKHVAPVRKSLGIRTAFNLLGPLTNAAKAQHVVIGVFDENLVELMADSLMEIGSIDHGVIVHGCGLDEISPLGPSTIIEIKSTLINEKKIYSKLRYEFDPISIGIPRCQLADLKGGNCEENALALREVLKAGDHSDAKRNAVLLNAGMGIYVYGNASSIAEGVEIARQSLSAGSAERKLEEWIRTTQRLKAENI